MTDKEREERRKAEEKLRPKVLHRLGRPVIRIMGSSGQG